MSSASASPQVPPSRRLVLLRALYLGLVFCIPPVYLALVIWLQPSDLLGDPVKYPWLGRLLYDDYDWTAITLRALNANMGRQAGRVDDPCWDPDNVEKFYGGLDSPAPLQPRYFLEYPHTALWLFRLAYLFQPGIQEVEVPTAVADACHNRLVEFVPQTDNERRLWHIFRRTIQINEGVMVLCLLALMAVLLLGYEPGSRTLWALGLCVLPGALYFTLNRFDMAPALLTALSLACLGRRWVVLAGVFLGTAVMVKVYPVLLAPLVFRYLLNNRRAALAWALAFAATLIAWLLPALLPSDWTAIAGPYRFQLSRTLEAYTLYGTIFPVSWGGPQGKWFRLGSVVLAISLLGLTRPADMASLLRRSAVVLIVFVVLQVFYSPQWILWLLPLLVPLAGRHWSVAGLVLVLDLVTYGTFPIVFDRYFFLADKNIYEIAVTALITARFLVLALLVAVLLWTEFRRKTSPGG